MENKEITKIYTRMQKLVKDFNPFEVVFDSILDQNYWSLCEESKKESDKWQRELRKWLREANWWLRDVNKRLSNKYMAKKSRWTETI